MRILYITEGAHDEPLHALITRVGSDRADLSWPIRPEDLAQYMTRPKRGHGRVLHALRCLAAYAQGLKTRRQEFKGLPDFEFLVATLDNRAPEKAECRTLAGQLDGVLGIAIEEFEAWILSDRQSILSFLSVPQGAFDSCVGSIPYRPERDQNPKATLDCLCEGSDWGVGWDAVIASQFAEEWARCADIDALETNSPRGFKPFSKALAVRMRRAVNLLPLTRSKPSRSRRSAAG